MGGRTNLSSMVRADSGRRRELEFRAGKKGFGSGCHFSGILDGCRIGVLTKGDLNFAKSVSICPPENSTGVGLIIVVLNDLEACRAGAKKRSSTFCLAY